MSERWQYWWFLTSHFAISWFRFFMSFSISPIVLWIVALWLYALVRYGAVRWPARLIDRRCRYFELHEIDAQTWDVLWKVPAKGDKRLSMYVQLSATCQHKEPGARFIGGAYIERWRTSCADGLEVVSSPSNLAALLIREFPTLWL